MWLFHSAYSRLHNVYQTFDDHLIYLIYRVRRGNQLSYLASQEQNRLATQNDAREYINNKTSFNVD